MSYRMSGDALARRRYASPYYGSPTYGLLDALSRPELVRASDVSQSHTPPQPETTGISPFRWLAGQVGLLDLLGATDAGAQPPVPITPREPDEPSWFDRTKARFRETFPPVPPPEMVRDGKGGVWRKDIYDLIDDIAVAEREDEAALRRRIQDVLADAPLTRDRWFHYELSNRLDGDDPETIRTALRDWGHEQAIQVREQWSQLIPGVALAGSQLLRARSQQSALPQTNHGSLPATIPAVSGQQPAATRPRSGGRRGSPETRTDLEQQIQTILRLNPRQRHRDGSRKDGEEVPEEYIPNPAGRLLGDGREKSIRPDATFVDPSGNLSRFEHADVTRFGKPTLREDAKAQREFRWTHSNGYNVPQSSVYVILKRHQLERIENRDRKGRRKRQDDEDR